MNAPPCEYKNDFIDNLVDKGCMGFRKFLSERKRGIFLAEIGKISDQMAAHVRHGVPFGSDIYVTLLNRADSIVDLYAVTSGRDRLSILSEIPVYTKLLQLAKPRRIPTKFVVICACFLMGVFCHPVIEWLGHLIHWVRTML